MAFPCAIFLTVLACSTGSANPLEELEERVVHLRRPLCGGHEAWEEEGWNAISLQAALENEETTLRKAFGRSTAEMPDHLDICQAARAFDAPAFPPILRDTAAHRVDQHGSHADRKTFAHCRSLLLQDEAGACWSCAPPSRLICSPKGVQRYHGNLAVSMDEGCFSVGHCSAEPPFDSWPKTAFVGRPNGHSRPRCCSTELCRTARWSCICVMQVAIYDQLIQNAEPPCRSDGRWTICGKVAIHGTA